MTRQTDFNLKKETAILDGVSNFIVTYIEEYGTRERFDRIFEATYRFYKTVEQSFVFLINQPQFQPRNLIEIYVNNELAFNWQELIVYNLEQRKRSNTIQKFLAMSQEKKEICSYELRKRNLRKKLNRLYKSIYYGLIGSYLGRKVTENLYKKCLSCHEKLGFDIKWGTQYFTDEDLTNTEINEMLDYCIGVIEEMSKKFSPSLISDFEYSGRAIQNNFDLLYAMRYNLTWIFNRFIYLRPYVKPEHVKLLYNTFSPHSYDIGYAVQGLAYLGRDDMECRKLAYEGLEKFADPILRQTTIENMKVWYGDFPKELYSKYTKQYNEFTGHDIPI